MQLIVRKIWYTWQILVQGLVNYSLDRCVLFYCCNYRQLDRYIYLNVRAETCVYLCTLTLHVSVEPEDAGVWESKWPPKKVAPLLFSLLLQQPAVGHTCFLKHLQAPDTNKNMFFKDATQRCTLKHTHRGTNK